MARICIDGYNLAIPQGTGVATYGYGLVHTLRRMGHSVDAVFGLETGDLPEMRETAFFEHFGRGETMFRQSQVRMRTLKALLSGRRTYRPSLIPQTNLVERRSFAGRLPSLDNIWSAPFLFQIAKSHFETFGRFLNVELPERPDIVHWTYPLPVRIKGAKNIYTLHDLVPLRLPYTTQDDKRYYYRLIAACIKNSDHICTVSEASRDDILARFKLSSDRVTNTYQVSPVPDAVSAQHPNKNAEIIEGMFGLKRQEYFLFFGAIDPKKNLRRIIDAYLISNIQTPLVLVTSRNPNVKGSKAPSVDDGGIDRQATNGRIIHLDYQDRATLFRLIQSAKAVLFPSLFEGFGLPALEALQLGTPVISSTVSSLPEVVGNAGLLVDPYQADEIAQAIRQIDGDTVMRERLIAQAPVQVMKFSTEHYQERLADMYGKLLDRDAR